MKKKSVNLITAVGVLVVLSGAYVGVKAYVAKQDAAEESSEEDENPEIVSIASADVKSIKFVIDKKEVTFEKDGDSWVKSDETDFPVDQDKIDTLVSSLNSITAERTLEDVEDASEYELDQPENTITVTTEDGETTVIQLGMENDSTSQEYIDLNKDTSTVYVVSNSTFSSFEGSLYDFAKSGTFPTVDSSTVSKISVDGKDSSYVVEKDENNFWNITGDGETEKADSAKATSLASALSSMAYASYVNYNCSEDELSQYGLDKPYAEITVDYQEEVEKDSAEDSTDENSADEENKAGNGAEEVSEASEDENSADENADSESVENDSTDKDTDSDVEEDSNEESADDKGKAESEEVSEDEAESESKETLDDVDESGSTEALDTEAESESDEVSDEENESENKETSDVEAESESGEVSDDATESESADASDEDSEPETEMVDRELVIQVGDQSSDGGRYVRVNDSNEIYTISEDSLNTFLGKTNADFWDLTVSYLSVNSLDKLDVNYEGEDYTVNVSRETSESDTEDTTEENTEEAKDSVAGSDVDVAVDDSATDKDSNASTTEETAENTGVTETGTDSTTETVENTADSTEDSDSASSTTNNTSVTLSYTLNGNDLDSTTFTTFYNKLINMTAQKRLTDEFKSNTDPEMAVKFTDIDGNETDVEYYSYDTNYYAAVTDGKVYLVNKMTVKELFQAFEGVTGKDSEKEASETNSSDTENETTDADASEENSAE